MDDSTPPTTPPESQPPPPTPAPRPARHVPVLLDEIVRTLAPQNGETVLDCTAGLGGHAAALGAHVGREGIIVLCDLDPTNLAAAGAKVGSLPDPPRVLRWHTNFADAPRRVRAVAEGGEGSGGDGGGGGEFGADVVLADLGFSSNQMEAAERGFSFMREGPLDMRLDPTGPVTAAQLVNTLPVQELEEIIRDYGEERHARLVAQKLVAARLTEPITTTARLATIVRNALGPRGGGASIDPATRTFQALRIAVNDELGNLHALLDAIERAARALAVGGRGGSWLRPGARVGIIAFHSLEDRLVKRAFAKLAEQGLASALTKKPIEAGPEETARNPRARSAKFRAVRLPGR